MFINTHTATVTIQFRDGIYEFSEYFNVKRKKKNQTQKEQIYVDKYNVRNQGEIDTAISSINSIVSN